MKILLYPIKSIMSSDELISKESINLIDSLKALDPSLTFQIIDSFDNAKDIVLILLQSGGSENYFKEKIFNSFNGPYYLLTYGSCNSLAAALEILAFINRQGSRGEVLHGDPSYIVKRIQELKSEVLKPARLGLIGKPSDWLIASNVDYQECLKRFNITIVDIKDQELIDLIEQEEDVKSDLSYDKEELNKALKIKNALAKIIKKYDLNGFTIRCFDMIASVKSTACLALAKFNDEGIVAICEGDVPSLISAYLIKQKLDLPVFQANPQYISTIDNTVEFAHCTIPFKMCKHYQLTTHFESGIGVAIHGNLKTKVVTIVKIDETLKLFYLASGTMLENEYRLDRCRTQINVKMNSDISYFLTSPLANHHLIIEGDHVEELKTYFKSFGMHQVI